MIVSLGATPFQLDLDDDRGDVVFLRLVAGKPLSVTIPTVDMRRIPRFLQSRAARLWYDHFPPASVIKMPVTADCAA
jgi:hypothetical protein